MRAKFFVVGLAILAVSFAGCSGKFDVKQTEPIRVEVNGPAEETRVSADEGAESKSEFQIEPPDEAQMITVVVEVTNVEAGGTANQTNATGNATMQPTVIMIVVEDRDKDERLAERRVESQQEAAQVQLDIDMKGRNNVVVVTQAIQGTADVAVSAQESAAPAPSPTGNATTTTYV